MGIFRMFKKAKPYITESSKLSPLVGQTVTHYHETANQQIVASQGIVKTVKPNGNLVLDTITIDDNKETGEYRKMNPDENYYSRIDRPGNPYNEQVIF